MDVQLTELKLKVDTAERERDFYFDKLRDIEILCQNPALQAIPVSPVLEDKVALQGRLSPVVETADC